MYPIELVRYRSNDNIPSTHVEGHASRDGAKITVDLRVAEIEERHREEHLAGLEGADDLADKLVVPSNCVLYQQDARQAEVAKQLLTACRSLVVSVVAWLSDLPEPRGVEIFDTLADVPRQLGTNAHLDDTENLHHSIVVSAQFL